jgi:hypothetical protein
MSEITHRTAETNGIGMHVAEQGTGPLEHIHHEDVPDRAQ